MQSGRSCLGCGSRYAGMQTGKSLSLQSSKSPSFHEGQRAAELQQVSCFLMVTYWDRCCCIPQLDGMSLEHYRAWQRDHDALKRRIVELELELQAALDKLEVYRRTQPTSTSDILLGDERGEKGRG